MFGKSILGFAAIALTGLLSSAVLADDAANKEAQLKVIEKQQTSIAASIKALQRQQTKLTNSAACLSGKLPRNKPEKLSSDDDDDPWDEDEICACCGTAYSCCWPSPCNPC